MIIRLEASADELRAIPRDESDQLFSELIRTSMLARHYVLIERDACDWAIEELDLGARQSAHLAHLKQTYAQKAAILRDAKIFLSVGLGYSGLEAIEQSGYRIGYRPLLSGSYLELPVLLVENADNDGDFVKQLLSLLRRKHPVKSYRFEPRHGGGSTIVDCFDREIVSKRIVVCLVDSDKIAPSHPDSPTVKGLRQVERLGTYVGGIFVTRSREIENHLPLEILRSNRLRQDYPDYDRLQDCMLEQEEGQPWLFFDVKDGFIGIEHVSKPYSPATHAWLRKTYAAGAQLENVTISGFGPNILREFLRNNKAIADFNEHLSTNYWADTFGGFFEEMLWFFATDVKRSAI